MEKFNIIGKNLTHDKVEEVKDKILDDMILGQELYEEELEKTESEKEMILLADVILENEFERLGLAYEHFIPDEHIHVLPENFAQNVLPEGASAVFDPYEQQTVIVRRSNESKIQLFHDLLHEMVHSVSHIKYQILEDDSVKNYRSGYSVKNNKDKIKYLESFNEAITEDFAQSLLLKNKETIFEIFNINKFGTSDAYVEDIMILDNIIIGLAEFNKNSEHMIRDTFYKGILTGEMMHLREIDKVFGEGSIRLLSFLSPQATGIVHSLYRKYFSINTSPQERYAIAEQILKLLSHPQ